MTQDTALRNETFQLKGRLFTLTVLELYNSNLTLFSDQLRSKVQQAPLFFRSTPVIIELGMLEDEDGVNFHQLIQCVREHGLVPVGVRGGSSDLQTAALTVGLGIFPKEKEPKTTEQTSSTEKQADKVPEVIASQEAEQQYTPTKVIDKPIRSGQQVYAQGGDLLVLSSVATGAEVIADGHIHIVGPLRGRALAGVSGNTAARIFCNSLEAELVSIAGFYKVSENLKDALWQQRAHIHLNDKTLLIDPIQS